MRGLKHVFQRYPFDDFLTEFKGIFMHPSTEGSVAKRLLGLQQGKRTVAEYIIDFCTVAAEAGWPDPALRGIFLQLINDENEGSASFARRACFF